MITEFTWSTLRFGKHEGKTLPQVVLHDPDWFFWAIGHNIFRDQIAEEAQEIASKATHIKIPRPDPENWRIKYQFTPDGKFVGLGVIPTATTDTETEYAMTDACLDLSLIHRLQKYDKFGYRMLLAKFRDYFFDGSKLTQEICEHFFYKEANFV